MITNITTGLCAYRQKQNKKPYYVSWQANGQQYYAYFAFRFLAESYKQRMIKETQRPRVTDEQIQRARLNLINAEK